MTSEGRKNIEALVRTFMVPKADGGNREQAYASLKAFCEGQTVLDSSMSIEPGEVEGPPVGPEHLVANMLIDVFDSEYDA